MTSLIGSYECKVDAKGRLALPMDLRKQLEEVLEKGFILKRSVFKPCLELHPIDEWNRMMEKMGRLNPFVKKNSDFIRRFTAGAKSVELDNNGRLQIAKDLVNYAKIEKNVVLSSYIYIIEIWNKDLYETEINDEEVDFGSLAEEVMGSLGDELP